MTKTTTEIMNVKAAVKEQNETRTTNAMAVEEQDKKETTSGGGAERGDDDERGGSGGAGRGDDDEERGGGGTTNANALGTKKMQTGAIDLLSFRTNDAATATEKPEVTIRPESSQRQMVIETRPLQEINREWEEKTRGSFEERGMNRFWSTPPQGLKRGVSRDVTEKLNTLKNQCETTDGDCTDGNAERERKGDWSHLYCPEYCSECGQPF